MSSFNFLKDLELKQVRLSRASIPELKYLISNSINLRMVVAFWTINPDIVSSQLSSLLNKSGSFACVDIHQPTNIDHICDLAQSGCNMYFHGKKIVERNKPDGKTPKLPTNLLHSKILLFDITETESELWVGSHNWTEYALGGFNIETSLRVRFFSNSRFYNDVVEHLESIRLQCSRVDYRVK